MTTLIIILIILVYIAIGLILAALIAKKGLDMTYEDITEVEFAPVLFLLVVIWPLLAIMFLFLFIFFKLFIIID